MRNKKLYTILGVMILAGAGAIQAQQGFGTNKPEPSAAVDITSTTKGFLPPRMNAGQIAAIVSPAEGLIVFNTTLQCLMYCHEGEFSCVDSLGEDNTMASNVAIEGLMRMGDPLTAVYTYSQEKDLPEDGTTYQWYYATDDNGTGQQTISGATSKTYTISSPVVELNYISVGVTPVNSSGKPGPEALSPWRQVVANTPPVFTSVNNAATSATVSYCATSDVQYFDYDGDGAGTHIYQWYRFSDKSGSGKESILGATASTYTFATADVGKYIQVGVKPYATAGKLDGIEYLASTILGPVGTSGCGTFKVTHTAGDVAPVTKTVLYETVMTDIGGTGNKCWIIQNLGADHPATSVDDCTEASAGWYWQYNRVRGYKADGSVITPAGFSGTSDFTGGWNIANDPCRLLLGSPWILPTYDEFNVASANAAFHAVLHTHKSGAIWWDGNLSERSCSTPIYNQAFISVPKHSDYGIQYYVDYLGNTLKAITTKTGCSVRCVRPSN